MPYEGLIKCRVLPPTNLLHPVLPYRCNKKLTFPLCATCCMNRQQAECGHSEDERALSGTWVTLEMKKALELGYRIIEVHEVSAQLCPLEIQYIANFLVFQVWHYEQCEQYDKEGNPDGGLFAAYINDFLRIKQEADGWPVDADTEEKKQAFLDEWKRREGIELRPEKMLKNSGLRALAKLCLNR